MRASIPSFATALLLATSSPGSDGVVEISHACAVQSGCFAGDTAGYPVTIGSSAGRSFRLTGDLVVPDAATSGISVAASYVSIDLNGFSIIRAGCIPSEVGCRPPLSAGSGIIAAAPSLVGLSVRNGSIIGMGDYGVFGWAQTDAGSLDVRWCGRDGVSVSTGSIVSGVRSRGNGQHGLFLNGSAIHADGNTAHENGGHGINAGPGSTLSGNTSFDNAFVGINSFAGAALSRNTAHDNGQQGILATDGVTLVGNTVFDNRNVGIACGQGCVIEHNSVRTNAIGGISAGYLAHVAENGVEGNAGPQISASDGSTISRNTVGAITPQLVGQTGIQCGAGCGVFENVVRNGAQGIALGAQSRYGRNVVTLFDTPAISGGVSAGDNLCNGSGC